jgi:hypothetical protein
MEVLMGALVKMPGKGVARPSKGGSGLALINATFTPFAQALVVADRCCREAQSKRRNGSRCFKVGGPGRDDRGRASSKKGRTRPEKTRQHVRH